jgi:hypothetical protein
MKIVLALVLVACVAIQASPVSDRRDEDGAHPVVEMRNLVYYNKHCTSEEIHHWKMTMEKPKEPCKIKVITQYRCGTCDKDGKNCKAAECPKSEDKVGDDEDGDMGKYCGYTCDADNNCHHEKCKDGFNWHGWTSSDII